MVCGTENGYLLSFPLQESHVSKRGKEKKSERQDQGVEEDMVLHVENYRAPC